jgi:uncharacterized membrane protein YozB (DUF420 family)
MNSPYAYLPPLIATLNSASAVFLLLGRWMISQGKRDAHKYCMLAAFSSSTVFLACYLYFHYRVGNVHFLGQGWIRPVYFAILITHVALAFATVPLVLVTLSRGLTARYDRHRRIARWTFPIWLYVSITGVLVYFMLYQWYPNSGLVGGTAMQTMLR